MELVFDERGLLLPGVHDVSIEKVKAQLGGFRRSDRRPTLFAKLAQYLESLKNAGLGESVILDGSFVMECVDEPDDIDILLVLPVKWDDAVDLKPYQYNLVSKKAIKRTLGFDLFTVKSGSVEEAEWIDFFKRISNKWRQKYGWAEDTRKGILWVVL